MSKKTTGRALAGLAALGAAGALAASRSGRVDEERVRSMSPAPPIKERAPLKKLQDELELRIQEDRFARGVPAVTDEEQAEKFKGIRGVRSGTGVPIRSGDELLQTETFKKGGAVKGWGKARGARKAKVY